MPFFYFLLVIMSLFTACSSPAPQEETGISTPMGATDALTTIDSAVLDTPVPELAPPPKNCSCPKRAYQHNMNAQLIFKAYKEEEMQQLVATWKDSAALPSIHSLRLVDYDSLPEELAIFKEVTKIYMLNAKGTHNLDIFPKLEEIHFFGGRNIQLSTGNWRKKLKVLSAQKTIFEGLKSFQSFPNLAIIDFAYSRFEHFPSDLEQLTCLQELHLNAYLHYNKSSSLDLSTIDLSQHPCLREAHFHSWYKAFTGVPKGMLAPSLEVVRVHHGNLTEEEQEELKEVKHILADRE